MAHKTIALTTELRELFGDHAPSSVFACQVANRHLESFATQVWITMGGEMKRERERERKRERAERLKINHKTEQHTYTNAERPKERNNIYKKFKMQNEWKYGWLAVGWND
jgi:hypothetical protein